MNNDTEHYRPRSKWKSTFAAFMAGTVLTGGLMLASDELNLFTSPTSAVAAVSSSATKPAAADSQNSGGVASASLSLNSTGNISQIVEQSSPAVVKIETKVKASSRASAADPFFRQFFGGQAGEGQGALQDGGMGTGFIFEKTGYILTNEHVIEGAEEIWVTVQGYDKPFKATLLGNSYDLDLAALKIEGDTDFPYLQLGNPDESNIGDWVVAIGNPYGFDQTVTVGVLSAKERPITIPDEQGTREYKHLLQTDASINPGNSGGPLLNLDGEVIGINTAVNAEAQGIGFAIPTTTIASVLDNLKNNVTIPKEPVPYLGIAMEDVNAEWSKDLRLNNATGAVIAQIDPKGPAFAAGIRTYDVITGINGQAVANASEVSAKVKELKVGDQAVISVIRNGQKSDITVTVADKNAQK